MLASIMTVGTLVVSLAVAVVSADTAGAEVSAAPHLGSATAAAVAQGSRVEVTSLEDEYSDTFVNPDGSLTTETSLSPLRVMQDSAWVDVDYDLRHVDGGWSPTMSPMPVVFSDGADTDAAALGGGLREIDLSWEVTLPRPTIDGATAIYDLGAGQSLALTATPDGFEQSLVLARTPTSLPRIKLPFDASSLTLSVDEAGGYTFDNAAGTPVYTMPAPIMYGSQVDPDTGVLQSRAVSASVTQTADGARLDLTPSPMLRDRWREELDVGQQFGGLRQIV